MELMFRKLLIILVLAAAWPAFANAQTYGTVSTATSSSFGVVKPDNSTVTISGGVLSAPGGGSTTITLAPGATSTPGTCNTGTQTITNGSTLSGQGCVQYKTANYTVADTDAGTLAADGGGAITFTLLAPTTDGYTSPTFEDVTGHGYTLTTPSGLLQGFSGGGSASATFPAYTVTQCAADGTNYTCAALTSATATAPSGPAYIQGCSVNEGSTSVSSVSCTMSAAIGSGHEIAIFGSWEGSAPNIASVSFNTGSGTCAALDSVNNGSGEAETAHCDDVTGGPTIVTVNFTSSVPYAAFDVDEISGVTGIDGSAHTTVTQDDAGTGTNAVTTGSIAATSGDFVWGAAGGSGTLSAGTGFTLANTGLASKPQVTEYQIATGSTTVDFTQSVAGNTFVAGIAFTP
jgi:hypothetical protein